MDTHDCYGPVNCSLLTLQSDHRSGYILADPKKLDAVLRSRNNDSCIWGMSGKPRLLHGRVLKKLDDMGFYGVYSCMSQKIDNHLITALVERWRRETHTFHFPVGEATVTLEDVGVLWRLPVDGKCVSAGINHKWDHSKILDWCQNLIGYRPTDNDIDGFRIRAWPLGEWLAENEITDDSEVEQVEQQARAYALLLMGCVMFTDCSGNFISLVYLQNLVDIHSVRGFSWASAVLAYLYRELCTACDKNKRNIGGALRLLQVWAWLRILPLRPIRMRPVVDMEPSVVNGYNLPIPAHAARWNAQMTFTSTSNNKVRITRDLLDELTKNQFLWTPYDAGLPEIALLEDVYRPLSVRSTCPLIFYGIVEMHYPERVLRQFGLVQIIPSMPEFGNYENLHGISKRHRINTNWTTTHAEWIERWNNRYNSITPGEIATREQSYSSDYYPWYRTVTRLYISPSTRVVDRGYQPGDSVAWHAVENIAREGRQRWSEGSDLWDRLDALTLNRRRGLSLEVRRSTTGFSGMSGSTSTFTDVAVTSQQTSSFAGFVSMSQQTPNETQQTGTSSQTPGFAAFSGLQSSPGPSTTIPFVASSFNVDDIVFQMGKRKSK